MGFWNLHAVEPFSFDNTYQVRKGTEPKLETCLLLTDSQERHQTKDKSQQTEKDDQPRQ